MSFNTNIDVLNPKKKLESGKYFDSLEDYSNDLTSFAYEPTDLYHSSYVKVNQDSVKNYIFAYYVESGLNEFFQGYGVNNADSIYKDRARGILISYGNLQIPSSSENWRAYGMDIASSDLQYIVYDIDPLTGNTDLSNDIVNTIGYFDDGIFESTISVRLGNLKYPKNVTAVKQNEIPSTIEKDKGYQLINSSNNEHTPFFISKDSWWPTIDWDIGGKSLDEILSKFQTVPETTDAPDVSNIVSSLSQNNVYNNFPLPNKKTDWNFASLTPIYEYLRILSDKKYLTTEKNSVSSYKDFVFRIHLNTTKLTDLQKETLEYVKSTYGLEKYIDLTSFIYSVNGSWVKEKLLELMKKNGFGGDVEYVKNHDSFNTLDSLRNSRGGVRPVSLIQDWIKDYAEKKLQVVDYELFKYEQEYLSKKVLSQINDINYNIQESYSLEDYKSFSSYLISKKGGNYGMSNQDGNIDKVILTSGSNIRSSYQFFGEKYNYLANSGKDEDISNALTATTKVGGTSQPKLGDRYSINEKGEYLINLVRYINDCYFSSLLSHSDENEIVTAAKNLAKSLVNQFDNYGYFNVNDYYHLFCLINPAVYYNSPTNQITIDDFGPKDMFSYNDQNLSFYFNVKGGFTPSWYAGQAVLASPYGNAAVVNIKWLESNNKEVLPVNLWYESLKMSSEEFFNWKKEIDSKYLLTINSIDFLIIGTGISFENSYPIVSPQNMIPNTSIESVVYVDDIGYKSLLLSNSQAIQSYYYAINFKNNKADINEFNKVVEKYMKKAYSSFDVSDSNNLLTARISYPNIIQKYIELATTILVIVLVIIGVYLAYLLIKIYIEKNQVSLAIAKANGLSTFKISVALSAFGFIVSVISGTIAYLLALFSQSLFLNILDNYWFISIIPHNFSIFGLLGGALLIYIAFFFFVLIGVWKTFRSPINELLTKSSELKINKLLYLMKSRKIPLFALTKFRISLTLSKLTRFFLFIILCSVGLSIISVGAAIPNKFEFSQKETLANKKYDYRYNLQTPSEQSGLYKIQDYAELGTTDKKNGIYDIYTTSMNISVSNPYTVLLEDESNSDYMALRNLDGSIKLFNGEKKYFSNFLLPSYAGTQQFATDLDFFRNVVVSKWLVDFEISIAGIYINAWSYVSQSFPGDLISKINALSNNFVSSILDVPELKKINDEKNFIIRRSDGNYAINAEVVIDLSNITKTDTVRFTNDFLTFIGMVYGDEELSSKDAKIAFGIIPFRNLDEKTSETETYTYLDVTLNDPNVSISSMRNNGKNKLVNINQQIVGIKKDSDYVKLLDENGDSLNHLLFEFNSNENNNQIYPLIINQGAAYQYSLSVGDLISVDVNNTYDRFSKNILEISPIKKVKFKVVGISTDSFGINLYTSQKDSNEILKLNFSQGATIVSSSSLYLD
ncbi:MAG: ABC transporter permease, partial [Malacoplasma sp.]|nr:ABC transporter permease [Malacoplasma sp.]